MSARSFVQCSSEAAAGLSLGGRIAKQSIGVALAVFDRLATDPVITLRARPGPLFNYASAPPDDIRRGIGILATIL